MAGKKARKTAATPPSRLVGESMFKSVDRTGKSASTALAVVPMKLPPGMRLVRRLTMPSLVLKKQGDERYLEPMDAIRVSSVPGKIVNGKQEDPAKVCTVTDATTGEQFTLLVPAVVRSTWERDYPDESYVHRLFYIRNEGKREGKRHIDFTVAEVAIEEAQA